MSPMEHIVARLQDPSNAAKEALVVRFDPATRRATQGRPGFLSGILRGQETVWYQVRAARSIELVNPAMPLANFLTGERLTVPIRARVAVPAGQETAVVERLYDPVLVPDDVLLRRIQAAFSRRLEGIAARSRDAAMTSLRQHALAWTTEVRAEIEAATGLHVELVLDVPRDPDQGRVDIQKSWSDVVARDDLRGRQDVTVTVALVPTNDVAREAVPRTKVEWEDWLAGEVKRAYREEVTLLAHWFERERVEGILRRRIEDAASRIARRVSALSTKPPSVPVGVVRTALLEQGVRWSSERWNVPVDFSARATFTLREDGAGVYREAAFPPLQAFFGD